MHDYGNYVVVPPLHNIQLHCAAMYMALCSNVYGCSYCNQEMTVNSQTGMFDIIILNVIIIVNVTNRCVCTCYLSHSKAVLCRGGTTTYYVVTWCHNRVSGGLCKHANLLFMHWHV